MKFLRKYTLSQLFLLITFCAAPFAADASTSGFGRHNSGFSRSHGLSPSIGRHDSGSCCASSIAGPGFLSPFAGANTGLTEGTYQFGQFESSFGRRSGIGFEDPWSFTVAADSRVSLTLTDLNFGGTFSQFLSTTNLGLELFDGNSSLGSITPNHSLDVLLAADTPYTFVVSGSARGILGGFYLGRLDVTPTAVPIFGALPLFGSALVWLGMRVRRRSTTI